MSRAGFILVSALALSLTASLAAEENAADDAGWVGKSRDEVVEKWGAPSKVKKQRDGELLIYEREVLVKFAYRTDGDYSKSYALDKDESGKRRVREKDDLPPEPVYRKVKFKFFLDGEGKVTRFEQPSVKNADLTSMPRSDGPPAEGGGS